MRIADIQVITTGALPALEQHGRKPRSSCARGPGAGFAVCFVEAVA